MKEIPLAQGIVVMVDDDDFERLSCFTWQLHSNGYARRAIWNKGKSTGVYMHRELAQTPKGMLTDHINGDKLDNRKGNLRICDYKQNGRNTAARSGYKGVTLRPRPSPWQARICVNGQQYHLGYFKDAESAARVYDAKARELFGEFARLNFPEDEDALRELQEARRQ